MRCGVFLAFERPQRDPVPALHRIPSNTGKARAGSGSSRVRPGVFLCLASEIAKPGDYIATTIGETAVVVTRDAAAGSRLCQPLRASRQPLVLRRRECQRDQVHLSRLDLRPDRQAHWCRVRARVKRQGGMPPEFRKDEHEPRPA